MLRSGAAISRRAFAALVAAASSKSWAGVMGSDWCGTRVLVRGGLVSEASHRVNGALTGYERSGHTPAVVGTVVAVGEIVEVRTRVCTGRNLDGDRFFSTTIQKLVVV